MRQPSRKCRCATCHLGGVMLKIKRCAWEVYRGDPKMMLESLKDAAYMISHKHNHNACGFECEELRGIVIQKFAIGMLYRAFNDTNRYFEQKIMSMLGSLLGPIQACEVYEHCMCLCMRGYFRLVEGDGGSAKYKLDTSINIRVGGEFLTFRC